MARRRSGGGPGHMAGSAIGHPALGVLFPCMFPDYAHTRLACLIRVQKCGPRRPTRNLVRTIGAGITATLAAQTAIGYCEDSIGVVLRRGHVCGYVGIELRHSQTHTHPHNDNVILLSCGDDPVRDSFHN